jgi:hypothetical protein
MNTTHLYEEVHCIYGILALLVSCGKSGDKGELVGVQGGKWHLRNHMV